MNFTQLRTALADRGFNHLTSEQLGDDINQARMVLDHSYYWPFREQTLTGPSPLSIADLATVIDARDTTTGWQLRPASFEMLSGWYDDLAFAGDPEVFYVTGGTSLVTYPVSTHPISVRYYRQTPVLSVDTDTPLAPSQFHYIYVLLGQQLAYLRTDNQMQAQGMQPPIDVAVQMITGVLLGGQQIAGSQMQGYTGDGSCDG